ncbi:MAG: diaminopimelate decarboxylase [Myxococcaceae bacterium]|nr:diaminopimelate decarboxylase [Myxococcaceae bacterium]
MSGFSARRGLWWAEQVPLLSVAEFVGTPTYVYSTQGLVERYQALDRALVSCPHLIAYSVKANSNLALLKLMAEQGAGFDIVSLGELARVRKVRADMRRVVFSGVGKTAEELDVALAAKIALFNVESASELVMLDALARRRKMKAPFAIRVNPDVDARTHRHLATGSRETKFGVPVTEAKALYAWSRGMKGLRALGVDGHIGSQMTRVAPLERAVGTLARLYRSLCADGFGLEYLDVGGGWGIDYQQGERVPTMQTFVDAVLKPLRGLATTVVVEPGRWLVGNAGVLLARVQHVKPSGQSAFAIVDAGMNDLLRPALYQAKHAVTAVARRPGRAREYTVVGPICETADVMAKAVRLSGLQQGDVLAIHSAGAYGMSMASNYNSRPRPAEVLVEGGRFRVIRERETVEQLWRGETL